VSIISKSPGAPKASVPARRRTPSAPVSRHEMSQPGSLPLKSGASSVASSNSGARVVAYSKRSAMRNSQSLEFQIRQEKTLLQIRIETSPQLLQYVGEFAKQYTTHRFHSRTAEKLALASYELVENAITYGSVSGDVVYTLSEADQYIEICVTNDSSNGRLASLRAHLERLRVDAEKVFHDEMDRSIAGTGARAALGLARVCHEAQMDIALEAEGCHVTVRARCPR